MSAIVAGLKAYPMVNSSWSDEGVLIHKNINIGMAASLGEEGLIVPVIKGADNLSLLAMARSVNDLANRARNKKLQPDEVKGGTFTLTNHGISGSLFAFPVINQPQCGILGVGAMQKRVIVIDDAIAIRPMVYLSFVFDHRILDGASADWFLAKVKETLENWNCCIARQTSTNAQKIGTLIPKKWNVPVRWRKPSAAQFRSHQKCPHWNMAAAQAC